MPDPLHIAVEFDGTVAQSPAEAARVLAGAPATAAPPAIPGYELLGELGRGAMGIVYRARQVKLNRLVALKMVLRGDRIEGDELIRFLAEAEAVAAVWHPNVVQIYECGEVSDQPYMALEFLPGGTLAERLARAEPDATRTPADCLAAAKLVGQIARGVAAAHAAGVVHRDLKPANVLFDDAGVPKVTDFGLAKRGGGSDLTAKGVVMGTPAYMPPEQASGQAKFVGPPADVWALGVILYQSLTGRRPFSADDTRSLLAQIMTAEPLPPREQVPAISQELELICLKCLSKRSQDRYPTAKELADDLDSFVRAERTSVFPLPMPDPAGAPAPKRRHRVPVALAALLVAVAAVALVVINRPARPAVYANGADKPLFDGKSAIGWQGQGWTIEKDAEGTPVLKGQGEAARALHPMAHFRVTLRIDLHRAEAVELAVAGDDGPPDAAARWVVRLDSSGAAFGKRVGAGAFEPLRAAVPLPARTEAKTPYLHVRYERAGGVIAAWLGDQPLGHTAARGLKAPELRLNALGGPVRIEAAYQTELIEQKK